MNADAGIRRLASSARGMSAGRLNISQFCRKDLSLLGKGKGRC